MQVSDEEGPATAKNDLGTRASVVVRHEQGWSFRMTGVLLKSGVRGTVLAEPTSVHLWPCPGSPREEKVGGFFQFASISLLERM